MIQAADGNCMPMLEWMLIYFVFDNISNLLIHLYSILHYGALAQSESLASSIFSVLYQAFDLQFVCMSAWSQYCGAHLVLAVVMYTLL